MATILSFVDIALLSNCSRDPFHAGAGNALSKWAAFYRQPETVISRDETMLSQGPVSRLSPAELGEIGRANVARVTATRRYGASIFESPPQLTGVETTL
jgi:hypothetical protein